MNLLWRLPSIGPNRFPTNPLRKLGLKLDRVDTFEAFVDGSLIFTRPTNWTCCSIYKSPTVIKCSSCLFDHMAVLEKLGREEKIVIVSCKQMVPPTVNQVHRVVCYIHESSVSQYDKVNLHIDKDMRSF